MFLLRNKEEVVFVQKNGVENRADDVASESRLLPTDSLNGAPIYLSNDMFGDFELTICRKIAIDLQQFFLFSFGSCTCADINELCHEFVQHFALLPFLKSLPGGHWLKSKSLKLKDNFGRSSLTFRSFRTLAVRTSEAVVLLNLLSNLLFFFAAILSNKLVDVAEIRNGTIAPQQIIF